MLWRVTAHLASPIVLRDELHLDALLEALHPDARLISPGRDIPATDVRSFPIPLLRHRAIGICSAAQFPDDARISSETVVKRKDDADYAHLARPFMLSEGPGKNSMIPLSVVYASHVYWLAWSARTRRSPSRGVRGMLRRARSIGAYRRGGYGSVRRWDVEPMDGQPMDAIHRNGRTLRHIPSRWAEWAASRDHGPCRAPYWHHSRSEERVPAGTECALTMDVIEALHAFAQ
jgi:hypothetical protein